jgi:hypothetical protein
MNFVKYYWLNDRPNQSWEQQTRFLAALLLICLVATDLQYAQSTAALFEICTEHGSAV